MTQMTALKIAVGVRLVLLFWIIPVAVIAVPYYAVQGEWEAVIGMAVAPFFWYLAFNWLTRVAIAPFTVRALRGLEADEPPPALDR